MFINEKKKKKASCHLLLSTHCSSMKIILLLLLIAYATVANSSYCKIFHEKETIFLRHCERQTVEILTTRCYGFCSSEDYLVRKWPYGSNEFQHHQTVNCCKPNATRTEQIIVPCKRNQPEIISFETFDGCVCDLCRNDCEKSY